MESDYVRMMKRHLGNYKVERLGVRENGVWKKNGKEYAYILPQSLFHLNIIETYRKEFWSYKNERPEVRPHQDFHHLNSSQAMCFNLFFPFVGEGAFPSLLKVLEIEANGVREAAFEKVLPGKEGTHFDFFLRLSDGRKILLETKLTEGFGGTSKDDEHEKKFEKIYQPKMEGRIAPDYCEMEPFLKNYQILRNIWWLDSNGKDALYFIFPKRRRAELKDHLQVAEKGPVQELRRCVHVLDLEDLVNKIQRSPLAQNPRVAAHFELFGEKYFLH